MKSKMTKILSGLLTVGLCFSLSACGDNNTKQTGKQEQPQMMDNKKMDDKNMQTASVSAEQAGITADPSKMSEKELSQLAATAGKFQASKAATKVQDIYKYPFLGLELTLPQGLKDKMNSQDIAMLSTEAIDEKQEFKYAFVSWNNMTKEQKEAMVEKIGDEYTKWEDSLERIGTLGMFKKEVGKDEISKVTRCSEHKLIGESMDKKYDYYVSTNSKPLAEEVKNIQTKIIKNEPTNISMSAFSETTESPAKGATKSIPTLSAKTIEGNDFTEKDFAKYDLTMVNIFTTWCTACVHELPELEKLHQEMKGKNVNVVGVVLDTVDDQGENQPIIDKAKLIKEKTGVTYDFVKPDSTYFNGRLMGVQGFPETFFVDKNGNIVGDSVLGSRDFNGWKEIVEKELKNVKGNK